MVTRLDGKVVVLSLCGSLGLAILAGLWLQIPDSHVWQFCLSMLVGLAFVLGALWLKTFIVRRIRLGQRYIRCNGQKSFNLGVYRLNPVQSRFGQFAGRNLAPP